MSDSESRVRAARPDYRLHCFVTSSHEGFSLQREYVVCEAGGRRVSSGDLDPARAWRSAEVSLGLHLTGPDEAPAQEPPRAPRTEVLQLRAELEAEIAAATAQLPRDEALSVVMCNYGLRELQHLLEIIAR